MHNVNLKNNTASDNTIETPLELCKFINELVLSVMTPTKILDPCSGNGNLTRYFQNVEVLSYEIKEGSDFFDCTIDDCKGIDLVICNPPFNGHKSKRKLFPEEFLKHILDVVPPETPIVFITPHGLRHNVRKVSKRLQWLTTLNINSLISLPLDVFPEVLVHCEILIMNMPKISKSHYAYHPDTRIRRQPKNKKSLCDIPNKFLMLDRTFLEVSKTIVNCLGLQKKSGYLLCALANNIDSNGHITINSTTRNALATILETNEQVITNHVKSLTSANLLIKKSRGYYLYNLISVADCRRIANREYDSLRVDIKYYKNDCSPVINILIE